MQTPTEFDVVRWIFSFITLIAAIAFYVAESNDVGFLFLVVFVLIRRNNE